MRIAQRRSEVNSPEMSLEGLARRPLNRPGSGPIFRPYKHATPQDRIVPTVNGVSHQLPSSPTTTEGPGRANKRELPTENVASQPSTKKRLRLSLSKSHSPSQSVCSSGSSSRRNSLSSSLQSSTPPLSPDGTKTETLTAETPLVGSKRRKGSTPPKRNTSSSQDHARMESENEPLKVVLIEEGVPFSPLVQPNTSHPPQTPPHPKSNVSPSPDTTPTPLDAPPPLDVTPPLDEIETLAGSSSPQVETIVIDVNEASCHDISQWCEGRMSFSCDLPKCKPIDKFSSGHLENYAEMVSKEGDLENYLNTAERLVNHGCFFPINKLDEVFRVLWKCRSEQAVKRMHFILQQDLSLRTDTSMKESHFSHWMKRCLKALETNRHLLVASVQLLYLHNLLVKNLDTHTARPKASLVDQLLSTKKTLNINAVLDAVFSLLKQTTNNISSVVPLSPLDCLLGMICLPLLTSEPAARPEFRTKLAREVAVRLDKIDSHDEKYQLINAIPSNFLKEKVIDFVLERNFRLPFESASAAQAFSDNSVSFAKIISLHLHRLPRHPNGTPQSLSFFLQLLSCLIQSHLLTVTSRQPLVSLLPSAPPLPHHFLVDNSEILAEDQLQEALLDMHHGVLQLTDRLSLDEAYVTEITEPNTWFLLQLLSLTTSQS